LLKEEDILKQFESQRNKESFRIPDNYFDSLVSDIQDKISTPVKDYHFFQVPIRKRLIIDGLLLVALVIIFLLGYNIISPISDKNNITVKPDEISLYFEMQPGVSDELLFVEGVNKNMINSQKLFMEQNDTLDYLLEVNIQTDEILNDL
jgi:hypothetical protein